MKILIHDLADDALERVFSGDLKDFEVYGPGDNIRQCIGCLSCWFKTPGICSFKDRCMNITENLASADEVVIVSRCVFGSPSPFVKMVMDRMYPCLIPGVEVRGNEVRHRSRIQNNLVLSVYFYGARQDSWKKTAVKIMSRQAEAFGASKFVCVFHNTADEIRRAGT